MKKAVLSTLSFGEGWGEAPNSNAEIISFEGKYFRKDIGKDVL